MDGKRVDPKIAALRGGGVGHASLQTPTEYLSHWPGEEISKNVKAAIRSGSRSLQEDECCEGAEESNPIREAPCVAPELKPREVIIDQNYNSRTGEPQFVICKNPLRKAEYKETLYSLDHEAIEKEMSRIQTEHDQYALKVKSKTVSSQDPKPLNCAGAVYRALERGGINQLSSVCSSLKWSLFAITPDKIEQCVRHAKSEELRKYPQTKDFTKPSEKEEYHSDCRIS